MSEAIKAGQEALMRVRVLEVVEPGFLGIRIEVDNVSSHYKPQLWVSAALEAAASAGRDGK